MENLKIQHLSYSSIALFNRCPREWWLKYRYGITSAPTAPLAFGTAIHRTVQQALLLGGLDNENTAHFAEWLRSAATESKIRILKPEFDELVKTGMGILQSEMIQYLVNTIKVSTMEQIEVKVEFEVPGVPLPIIGYIDIIDDDGHPYDIKTSKWDWEEGRADEEVQPDFYLTALDLVGDHRHGGKFTHLILTKTPGAPAGYTITTEREDYQSKVFEMVQRMWKGVEDHEWEQEVVRDACAYCRLKSPCYYNK